MNTDRQHSSIDRMLDQAIVVEDLSLYGVELAELRVHRGEIVALVGSNGSGKSSVSQVLVGLLPAATGSARVLGLDPMDDAAELKGLLGYLVHDLETMGSLTSRDVLDICAAVRGCTTAYALELAVRLGLELDLPMGQLCRGQLLRLGVVQALMHRPAVIVLDDAMTDLDEGGRGTLAVVLREAAAAGAAVLITAQSETAAGAYADRIAIFSRRVVAEPVAEPAAVEAPAESAPQATQPVPAARASRGNCRMEHRRPVYAQAVEGVSRRVSMASLAAPAEHVSHLPAHRRGLLTVRLSHVTRRRCRMVRDPAARPPP